MNKFACQPWWQLLFIQISAITCLPAMMIGKILCKNYGWEAALTSIVIGNAILLLISIVFVCMVMEKTAYHCICVRYLWEKRASFI